MANPSNEILVKEKTRTKGGIPGTGVARRRTNNTGS